MRARDDPIDRQPLLRLAHREIDNVLGDAIEAVVRRDTLNIRPEVLHAVIEKGCLMVEPSQQFARAERQDRADSTQDECAAVARVNYPRLKPLGLSLAQQLATRDTAIHDTELLPRRMAH
ncbi:MAG: hypothetical protein M3R61_13755 [Chloroflexota bacterium]|nr:hypothetical protein [Chloroflexota bacterium]